MTTIAYRDGLLAADTQVNSGSIVVGYMIKIGRIKDNSPWGGLWGAAGAVAQIEDYVAWTTTRHGKPPEIKNEKSTFIHITTTGAVREYWGEGWLETIAPFYAWGSGQNIAMGAMAKGASAEEAVRIAAQYDLYTGGEVTAVSLGEPIALEPEPDELDETDAILASLAQAADHPDPEPEDWRARRGL